MSFLIKAQEQSSQAVLDQYNELTNYIPKSLENDTIYNPEIRISEVTFNSIINTRLHYRLKHFAKFTPKEIAWMEEKITKLATALHAEGMYILLGQRGGYKGCMGENKIEKIHLNTIKIIRLNFCYGCHDSHYDKDFIKIFNAKMYQLLQIKPPDYKTRHFYGTFRGKGEQRSKVELILTYERTFTLKIQKKNTIDFSEGLWENENDTLILTSKKITSSNDGNSLVSNGNWLELNAVKFRLKSRLKRSKLISLEPKKWKLKKVL
ncbi:hypothetical protein [uncultured Kordia sp.]|uniref:hypothetical protein n=1 Tax=uncultured Kordia sp. TaxID=507699 RepID=UPI002633E322|nr:hypothetical protein [uncultured Kordia sp.]